MLAFQLQQEIVATFNSVNTWVGSLHLLLVGVLLATL
jgi:hypothetical protein